MLPLTERRSALGLRHVSGSFTHFAMTRPDDPHARAILAAFTHVSGLLDGVERLAAEQRSPFARELSDLSAEERRRLRHFVAEARERMLQTLDQLGIDRPRPDNSARWGVETALLFADLALSETTARSLRRYGVVAPERVRVLDAAVQDLRSLLQQGKQLVAAPPDTEE